MREAVIYIMYYYIYYTKSGREHFHLLRVILLYTRSRFNITLRRIIKVSPPPRLNAPLPTPSTTTLTHSPRIAVYVSITLLVYGSDEGASQMLHTPYRTLNTPRGLGDARRILC